MVEEANTLDAPDDESRCAVCGRTLSGGSESGCVRGGCRTRPQPTWFYAPTRACVEYQQIIVDDGVAHRFYLGTVA